MLKFKCGGLYIDSRKKGNESRFINHSCCPNAQFQEWQVGQEDRVGVFALHDIQAGTEITVDYNFKHCGGVPWACKCGAPNCVRILGGDSALDNIVCQVCGSGEDEDTLELCDKCGVRGRHRACAPSSAGKTAMALFWCTQCAAADVGGLDRLDSLDDRMEGQEVRWTEARVEEEEELSRQRTTQAAETRRKRRLAEEAYAATDRAAKRAAAEAVERQGAKRQRGPPGPELRAAASPKEKRRKVSEEMRLEKSELEPD